MSIWKRIKGSKEAKNLLSNFFSLSLLEVAGYIFPLLTVPYLAHILGVELYGAIAFASAIIVYFQTFVDYGFIFTAVRDIARCRDNKDEITTIYSEIMWARGFLLLCAFILLLILIFAIPKFYEMIWLLLASFLIVVGYAMFPTWVFQGMEKMKYITIFNVIIKLIFTVAVFCFIKDRADYLLQPIFTGLGYIISGASAMWLINRWGIKLHKVSFSRIVYRIRSNFDLFLTQIIPNLYSSASVLFLGFVCGPAANGIYDAANRFNNLGNRLFSIISRTFYPFLSRRMDKHSSFSKSYLCISSVIAVLLYIFAPFIIHTFFPSDFDGAIATLRVLSISLVFLAIYIIYGVNFLIIKGFEKEVRSIMLYSSLFGLIIAIPSVYYLSYIGVAITVTASRGIMGIWSMIKVKQVQKKLMDTNA